MMFRIDDKLRVAAAICAVGLAVRGADKKMIGHSWDLLAVRPADVARNLDAWEGVPLDGISLTLNKKLPDGRSVGFGSIMNDPQWEKGWFTEDVKTIQQCASRNLKHNFLTSFWAPRKRLAWNDDAAWAEFAHNIGVLAWLAKAGQAKGILIDPEDYPETRQYFLAASDEPYAQTAALARRRGAQLMTSMAAEYPEITLLSFWMLSLHPSYLADDDPPAAAAERGDLWPAFINGMLDALPPEARMIDGDEHAYRYKAATKDFYLASWRTQNKALKLVDTANRMKYQTQVLAGFGLYLDMYTNPSNSPWYFGEQDGSRLNHLRSNFAQALDAAQEYIWVYGEQMDWIKWMGTSREKNPTWEERLPGFLSTLERLRDPRRWAVQMVAKQRQGGGLTNCIVNGGCVLEKGEFAEPFRKGVLPAGWWSWQEEKKRPGVFGTETQKGRGDKFSLCAVGVEQGCFGTSYHTSPGKEFVVEAYAQGIAPSLTIGWKRAGAWDWSLGGAAFRFATPGSDGWRHAFGLVQVPEGADELVVMLGTRQAEGERTLFDDVGLYSVTN
ncbi:MAG: hypothetical protein PHO37_04805 [Kiritimatiellae bacterium]|nr:hypothetical protein [Kiritimatiellia bacterium]